MFVVNLNYANPQGGVDRRKNIHFNGEITAFERQYSQLHYHNLESFSGRMSKNAFF